MGTRADFYVGRGADAEWLGSIAWDGYIEPPGIAKSAPAVIHAPCEAAYRRAVADMLKARDDATTPDQGWPWPWDNSDTTDRSYSFFGGEVQHCHWDGPWVTAKEALASDFDYERAREGAKVGASHPDMSAHKAVTLGKRSGLMVIAKGADGKLGIVTED
jgi:hypothetical protein